MESSFLEAHYYAGGLRHRAYSIAARPDWAPAPDSVGFSDEVPLDPGAAVVEIRRIEHGGHRLTWLAVYHPSVDARLGDRKNHAGVGVWLDDFAVVDARNLLHGLDVLAKKLAETANADSIDGAAQKFLQEYVPQYVLPLAELPDFPGLQFTAGRLAATCLTHVRTEQSVGESAEVGDRVLAALFTAPQLKSASRELIWVSPKPLSGKETGQFQVASAADDPLSRVLRELPAITKALTSEVRSLSNELEHARARTAEFNEVQARLRSLEGDPIHAVLDAVRDVGRKIDALALRPPTPAHVGTGRIATAPNPKIISRPSSPVQSEEDSYHIDWITLGVYGILIVLVVVLVVVGFDRYVIPLLWRGS